MSCVVSGTPILDSIKDQKNHNFLSHMAISGLEPGLELTQLLSNIKWTI